VTASAQAPERVRARAWRVLDNPLLWEGTRLGLDAAFGLYRRRFAMLRHSGLLDGRPSVLDVGCGIGHYSRLTEGEYLGIDLNCRYVGYARRRHGGPGKVFRCADVGAVVDERRTFDLIVMVDFLHHLPDEVCLELLGACARLAGDDGRVVNFEPVREQGNGAGRWIIDHDRGDHMRTLAGLRGLFDRSPLEVVESRPLQLGPIGTRAVFSRAAGAGSQAA
jgi:SAM-dependent methyltransferase